MADITPFYRFLTPFIPFASAHSRFIVSLGGPVPLCLLRALFSHAHAFPPPQSFTRHTNSHSRSRILPISNSLRPSPSRLCNPPITVPVLAASPPDTPPRAILLCIFSSPIEYLLVHTGEFTFIQRCACEERVLRTAQLRICGSKSRYGRRWIYD